MATTSQVKRETKRHKILTLVRNPQIYTCRSKYLFIISHMRARSSLLAHIFGSNPEICGYTELHNAYHSWIDLMKLRSGVYLDTRRNLKDKYLLDKVLHNPLEISSQILEKQNAKFVFLLREPHKTLKSIIRNCYATGVVDWREPEKALDYYLTRLPEMHAYASRLGKNAIFLESEQLINDPEHVLSHLSNWLNLKVKLNRNYSVFSKTGVLGYGDPLHTIKSGKIVKTNNNNDDIEIPKALLNKGQAAYDSCKEALLNYCTSI